MQKLFFLPRRLNLKTIAKIGHRIVELAIMHIIHNVSQTNNDNRRQSLLYRRLNVFRLIEITR